MTAAAATPRRPARAVRTASPRGLHRAPEVRTLHVVDLENLMGDVRTGDDAAQVWDTYSAALGVDRMHHVIVGSGPSLAAVAWFRLPHQGIRRVLGHGVNGGDLALLAEMADAELTTRAYQRLVIASGDGIFTAAAHRFRTAGLHVVQVVGRGRPHPNLAQACDEQVHLLLPPSPSAAPSA
ncbi:NYN domain-containing protein [Blastococcus sp. CT_GayMR20]|uniref:NYN domain-containing protein n=1 Tax=Blastococcus sp. CT_GayMR20 TaxID=2559609 RepID=UPI00107398A9|nr:NYN domain-containing protein [Blastococcus sp. CT_GayMR20]TFV88058.1 NYN domain-containing protein [Blastococcus sp. CT_GayMR20]